MGRLRGPALASACTRISLCMATLNLREFSSVMPALKKRSIHVRKKSLTYFAHCNLWYLYLGNSWLNLP